MNGLIWFGLGVVCFLVVYDHFVDYLVERGRVSLLNSDREYVNFFGSPYRDIDFDQALMKKHKYLNVGYTIAFIFIMIGGLTI